MKPRPTLGELVVVESSRGRELDGILFRSSRSRRTIIHVHGSFGNFYQGALVRTMARVYTAAGVNLLSVNMSSHDGLAEGYFVDGRFEYVGGSVSDFAECVADIRGAVSFARGFSDEIVLQGHSLGCDRVLHFLLASGERANVVLLSPCDSHQLQVNWIAPETVEEQIARLKNVRPIDPGSDWLAPREYGVLGQEEWTYTIPIMRRAFLSIAEGPPFQLISHARPASFSLDQRALVCVGGADALQVWPADVMVAYFAARLRDTNHLVIPAADHMFSGFEAVIAAKVVSWMQEHLRGTD